MFNASRKFTIRREFYSNFYHTQCGNSVFYGNFADFRHTYLCFYYACGNNILSMAKIPTLSISIMLCNLCYILLWIPPRSVVKIAIQLYQFLQHRFCNIAKQIFTLLYGNHYPPHGEFKLICIGKFARRTWVNFTQQYGKTCERCQQNKFYYAVWHLLLHYYRKFSLKILSVHNKSTKFVRQGKMRRASRSEHSDFF